MYRMLNALLIMLMIPVCFASSLKTLDEVIVEKVASLNSSIDDLETVAGRSRIRAWLPDSPTVSYGVNDNNSWKNWSVSTSVPFPLKSLYRDKVVRAEASEERASARATGQEILRATVETYLECAMPSEMISLLQSSLEDQETVALITKSLYASGAVPQADRVASELQLRQIEAQARLQRDLATDGCRRWRRWADLADPKDDMVYDVYDDISAKTLEEVRLITDSNRDLFHKKYEALVLGRDRLWAKYIPDIEFTVMKNNYFDQYRSGGPPVKYTSSWMVGIKLPFTFPFYDNTDFREEAARMNISKLKADMDRREADKNWEQAKKDWKRVSKRLNEISSKDLALAEAFVESALASYRSGKIGFADLVLARRTKLDLKIEEVNLKAQKLLAKTVCLSECDH